jgi:penicillin-binding protein 1A
LNATALIVAALSLAQLLPAPFVPPIAVQPASRAGYAPAPPSAVRSFQFPALPQLPQLPPITREPQVTYVDRSGAMLGVRGGRFAPPVDIGRLPPYVAAAFVSIEDRRFYEHRGFDVIGIARALATDVVDGKAAQGASTITQQLARNLFLSNDKNLERKALELVYAVELEQAYSKPQILGLYLSRIYFGAGAYGIEAASRRYFNKGADKLTVREAAILASLPKSPTNYNPAVFPERALARSKLVLDAMVETKAITAAERTKALAAKVKIFKAAPTAPAQYFIDWLDGQTRALVGSPRQDLVVETTLDLPLEMVAGQAVSATLTRYRKQKAQQAVVVSVDGQGRVRVLLGGADYATSPFNRAVDAHRQAGSAWKPFVYLTALESGLLPESPVVDEPLNIGNWSPHNFEPGYRGALTLQDALAHSVNTVAARLADTLGRDHVAATARRLGIGSPINTDPAMALGTTLVTPLEMADAYSSFADGGRRAGLYGIERIRTQGGKVLYRRPAPSWNSVIGNPALGDLNQMLRAVIAYGTGVKAAIPGYDVAGKTGTTSDYRDAWFCGFTGEFTTVVWVGRDDNGAMINLTGGSAPAEIWRAVMVTALKRGGLHGIPPGPPGMPRAPAPTPAPIIAPPQQPTAPPPMATPPVAAPQGNPPIDDTPSLPPH